MAWVVCSFGIAVAIFATGKFNDNRGRDTLSSTRPLLSDIYWLWNWNFSWSHLNVGLGHCGRGALIPIMFITREDYVFCNQQFSHQHVYTCNWELHGETDRHVLGNGEGGASETATGCALNVGFRTGCQARSSYFRDRTFFSGNTMQLMWKGRLVVMWPLLFYIL